jgi:hypothetical protein
VAPLRFSFEIRQTVNRWSVATHGEKLTVARLGAWRCARRGALDEEVSLARVARQRGGALEFRARFLVPSELPEEIAAHARQQVITLERGLRDQSVGVGEAGRGSLGHADRHGAIQFDDGRRRELSQDAVQGRNPRPIGIGRGTSPRVTRGDSRLQRVGADGPAERLGALQRRQPAPNQQPIQRARS